MSNRWRSLSISTLTAGTILAGMGVSAGSASAASTDPGLGSAGSYAILATATVTNTGPTVISGDVGLSPGTSVTGFPPAIVSGGTLQVTTAAASAAVADATTGYNDAATRSTTSSVSSDLAGQTLVGGVYQGSTLALSGQLTLDGQGDPDSTFILRAASTLTTASASTVVLTNGAQACHVYWQVGSSAVLGTDSTFLGTVLAHDSVTADTNVSVQGRLFALDGAVTLDTDTIAVPACAAGTTTPSPSSSAGPVVSPTSASPTPTAPMTTAAPTPAATPTPTATPTATIPTATATTPAATATAPTKTGPTTPPATPAPAGARAVSMQAARAAMTRGQQRSAATAVAASKRSGHTAGGGSGSVGIPTATGNGLRVTVPTSSLAYTGADVSAYLAFASLLLTLGAAMVTAGRHTRKGYVGQHRA